MRYSWLGFLLGGLLLSGCTAVKPLEETNQPEIAVEARVLEEQVSALDEIPPLGDIQAWGPQNKYYSSSNENFPNPERGMTAYADVLFPNVTTLQGIYAQGYSLIRTDILLDKWRYTALPADFLTRLDNGLDTLRKVGLKTIIRFMYTSPAVGGEFANSLDAPLNIVQTHIRQLGPILKKDGDVLAVLQGGFIGAWGEWHSSYHGLASAQNKTTILYELLGAMPSDRMVQIRTVPDIADRVGGPLSAGEAYNGSAKARVALKNMCFLANQDDAGTFSWNYQKWQYYKDYLAQASNYMAVGGETCEVNASNNRAACSIAVPEMGRYHWSYLNALFYRPNIDRWIREGCYYTIQQKLGYRFRLVQAVLPSGVNPGENFEMSLSIANEGFAAPYNPRSFEVVFRHVATGQVARAKVNVDPRHWLSNQTKTLKVWVAVPSGMPGGDYQMFVNLPDPKTTLSANPRFSIRLANTNTWEANTGFNSLGHTLKVGYTSTPTTPTLPSPTPPPPSPTPPPPPSPTPPPAPAPTPTSVYVKANGATSYTLGVGARQQLGATVIDRATNQATADQRLNWMSSNWQAISVNSNGVVTVNKAGTATIYALSVPFHPEGVAIRITAQ